MPLLPPLVNAEAAPDARATLEALHAKLGQVPNMYRTFAHAPKVLSAAVAMAQAARTELAPKLRELAYLKVTDLTGCHVWRHYHEALGRRAGLTDEQIRDLARFEQSAAYTAPERDVLRFAEQWSVKGHVDGPILDRLKLALSPEHLVTLAAVVAQANFTSRFNNVFGVELPWRGWRYRAVALSPSTGNTMMENPNEIRGKIRLRFAKVARSPHDRHPFAIGPDSAKRLGYDPAEIDALPAAVTESFAGVGNPFALGSPRPGETVLDLGCGAGVDSILAARRVGPTGRVVGVDATEEMVAKARANAATVGVANVEFHHGEADRLPTADGSVDAVISNGVFNLCFDKPAVLAEVYRVLKPGARLQMADVLLADDVTESEVERKGAWSDWIAGAVKGRSLLQMLDEAGFIDAVFHEWTGYVTSSRTQGGLVTARKPTGATVSARWRNSSLRLPAWPATPDGHRAG